MQVWTVQHSKSCSKDFFGSHYTIHCSIYLVCIPLSNLDHVILNYFPLLRDSHQNVHNILSLHLNYIVSVYTFSQQPTHGL